MTARVRAWAVALRLRLSAAAGQDGERGDVPGWVLITLMTAGLVSVLWFVAGNALTDLFEEAIRSVAPQSG